MNRPPPNATLTTPPAPHTTPCLARFELQGRSFAVSGLARDASMTIGSFVFLRASAAETLLGAPGLASYLFVTPERSEEHTSELQSLMRLSYAVFCLKQKHIYTHHNISHIDYSRHH